VGKRRKLSEGTAKGENYEWEAQLPPRLFEELYPLVWDIHCQKILRKKDADSEEGYATLGTELPGPAF
jgi:hypothetical protein